MPPNNKAPTHWIVNVLTTAGSLVISLGMTLIGEFVQAIKLFTGIRNDDIFFFCCPDSS
jgi:hypothetical protein